MAAVTCLRMANAKFGMCARRLIRAGKVRKGKRISPRLVSSEGEWGWTGTRAVNGSANGMRMGVRTGLEIGVANGWGRISGPPGAR